MRVHLLGLGLLLLRFYVLLLGALFHLPILNLCRLYLFKVIPLHLRDRILRLNRGLTLKHRRNRLVTLAHLNGLHRAVRRLFERQWIAHVQNPVRIQWFLLDRIRFRIFFKLGCGQEIQGAFLHSLPKQVLILLLQRIVKVPGCQLLLRQPVHLPQQLELIMAAQLGYVVCLEVLAEGG